MIDTEIKGFTQRLMFVLDQAGVPRRGRTGCVRDYLKTQGLEISKVSVYSWLRGDSRPDLDKVALLAKFAKTSCDYLLGMDELTTSAPSENPSAIRKKHSISEPGTLDLARMRLIRLVQNEYLKEDDLATLEYMANHLLEIRRIT